MKACAKLLVFYLNYGQFDDEYCRYKVYDLSIRFIILFQMSVLYLSVFKWNNLYSLDCYVLNNNRKGEHLITFNKLFISYERSLI